MENNAAVDKPPDGECKELELWMHNPVACVEELIGNPTFDGSIAYAPERVYADQEGWTYHYNEMWTGDWWWKTQVSGHLMGCSTHLMIPQEWLLTGVTIMPVILASNKTELSQFKDDKTAWPVYLTVGNLLKNV